jgi:uncharacterized protein (DUF58 family)
VDFGWFPHRFLRPRGWGMVGAGVFALLLAQVMGRRDLLALGVFLISLPLIAVLGIRWLKPTFAVYREFSPASVETQSTTTVNLAVGGTGFPGGRVSMEEQLPPRFGEPPSFFYPARTTTASGLSRYVYHLRSAKRGQFRIGPVTAEFSDPFGLSMHRHELNGSDLLTVTPAAVELPDTTLTGARGNDGITTTRQRANPSDDDVMTREYRHGDPMRRVHWPATARHGQLMVRQEESVTTPEATILLDSRLSAYAGGLGTTFATPGPDGRHPELVTNENFEWTVVAAMSIAGHLVQRNFALRLLDDQGSPGFHRSRSAPWPLEENYEGAAGLAAVADSLAAIELTGSAVQGRPGQGRPGQGAAVQGSAPHDDGGAAFGESLLEKLTTHRQRGPLIALLGHISAAEARTLAPAAEFGANAFAIVVTERPLDARPLLEALRMGGWRAIAANSKTSLTSAWGYFDDVQFFAAASGRTAVDARRAPTRSDLP